MVLDIEANIPPAVKHFKEHMCHNKHNSFFMFPTDSIEVSRLLRSMKSKTSVTNLGCVRGQYHTNNEQTQSVEGII